MKYTIGIEFGKLAASLIQSVDQFDRSHVLV